MDHNNYIAAKLPGRFEVPGPLNPSGEIDAAFAIQNTLSTAIGIMTVVAFIWFAFKLVIGAIGIISSGGDKGKIAESRNNITFGLIGVVVVVAAIFIARLVAAILGIESIFYIPALVGVPVV